MSVFILAQNKNQNLKKLKHMWFSQSNGRKQNFKIFQLQHIWNLFEDLCLQDYDCDKFSLMNMWKQKTMDCLHKIYVQNINHSYQTSIAMY
jgi:hypothetical protein